MDDRRQSRLGSAGVILGVLVVAFLAMIGAPARRPSLPAESPATEDWRTVPPAGPAAWRFVPPAGPSGWELLEMHAHPPPAPRARRRRALPRPRSLVTSALLLVGSIGVGLLLSAWIAGSPNRPGPDAGEAAASGPAPTSFSARSVESRRHSRHRSVIARARGRSIRVYRRPRSGKSRLNLTERRVGKKSIPLVFAVDGRRGDWLKVHLPVRPNGSTGWVRRRDVALAATNYRVRIDVRRHRLTVWRGRRVVARERIGTGAAVTPTPRGHYFITDLIRPPNAGGLYGPFAFGLSAYSPVLSNFGGGPGQIGVHGTNEPDKLGTDVSRGCIRVRNKTIKRLAKILPLGTPVTIVGRQRPVKPVPPAAPAPAPAAAPAPAQPPAPAPPPRPST